jgi:hypothetical protein
MLGGCAQRRDEPCGFAGVWGVKVIGDLVNCHRNSGGDDAVKIDKLVDASFALTDDCSHQIEARIGNAIAGKMICEIDESAGTRSTYEGTETAESVAMDVTFQSYAPGEETFHEGNILAKRSGDCS